MIVAIDGPSGSGKSSIAHAIADRFGLTFLDTGAMYRSVAAECLRLGVDPEDAEAVAAVARDIAIEFGTSQGGQTVTANGRDVTAEIRTPEVELAVSPVSANPAVREVMVSLQRKVGETGDVGGNLAQAAAATADPEEERRILADLKRRDDYDSSRATSPLRPADDAVIIDSSEMGFEDVVEKIASLSPALLARANA